MSRLFAIPETLDSDSWYTPPWVFEGLGLTFDLDVASPNPPLDWIPARDFYSESDDGLLQPWHGLVWCNPPYSNPAPWCLRWANHDDGLLLLRADMSTGGPFRAFTAADGIYVPRKRIQFVDAMGGRASSVNFSSVLMARGDEATEALFRLAASHGGTARYLKVSRPVPDIGTSSAAHLPAGNIRGGFPVGSPPVPACSVSGEPPHTRRET